MPERKTGAAFLPVHNAPFAAGLACIVPDDRRRQAEEIFAAVLDLGEPERSNEIRRLCGSDDGLRRDVESLFRCAAEAPGFLEVDPLSASRLDAYADVLVPQSLPKQVGPFQILGVLGAGGMGIVYRARSISPRRQVALKVIRPGLATGAMLRRFHHEAHVLARLKHAGIAAIYETGTADSGHGLQPYFAMELVEGAGLLQFARDRSLSLREKIEVMAKICDAIQHAHERGVVHRDLKPMNILVDARGEPKVLDFGVARLLESELGESRDAFVSMHTGAGQLMGTLAYMSPEQVAGDSAVVDAKSDIYSLGVILYELLSGRLPHDVSRMSLSDGLRIIREQAPARVSADNPALRGEIELIVEKAMQKEPLARYQAAAELSDDLRRYLADRPVKARRAGPVYLARKFIKRNRAIVATAAVALFGLCLSLAAITSHAGVAASTLAFVSVALGLAAALWQADRAKKSASRALIEAGRAASEAARANHAASEATREAARASAESARAASEQEVAQAVSSYLARLLESADPDVGKKREVTVREMLDRSTVESLSKEFAGKPRVLAKLHGVIGRAYEQLSLLDRAEGHYHAGLAVASAQIGADTIEHVTALNDLGHVFKLRDAFEQSEPMLAEAVERARRVLGPDHALTIDCKVNLASVLHRREKYADAERVLVETTASAERTLGPLHRTTHVSMNNLASARRERGDLAGAIPIRRRFLALARQAFGDENSATLMAMNNLATDLLDTGDASGAETLLRETVAARIRLLGADHRSTLNSQCNLAACLRSLDRDDEAEELMRRVVTRATETIEAGNTDRAKFELEYGKILAKRGGAERNADAERYMLAAHAAYAAALGPSGKRTRVAAEALASLLDSQGRQDEARLWRARSES